MESWNPSKGVIQGLQSWREVKSIRNELNKDLELRLLPRFARYLGESFEIDPADQDITPIEKVFEWNPFFKPEKFIRVFLDAFFPKWFNILHLWLTSDPNYEEVGQWYTWWQQQFPATLNGTSAASEQWEKGLEMMNEAMELGPERAKTELAPPVISSSHPLSQPEPARVETPAEVVNTLPDVMTLKDDLEEICEREGLLMLATRKAHPETGLPIFRISASASGTGGISLYIKGDVAYAQNKRERTIWDPLDVYAEGLLAEMAESR